ncbi:putative tetracycline resistance protein TetA [uncultured Eubacteriales bacterium]|uniref:Putative tetracycline resistance protein TetA n=1 Tax=uncultured Eubacteriales bacterium TaxID=172733 RepID=A0A212JXE7_9FIRM|nr:putative tetracycline resistance protein TetA [uncultured Eubacteriales bacterium]
MSRVFQVITFFKAFTTGLMAPVLTLALLAHGASITTLSLLLGTYSLSIIAMEIPSGIFADLYGRKKAALFACLLSVFSYCLLLAANAAPLLFGCMITNGLARAFSSGSIDSWAIDDAVANGRNLTKVTSQLSILESVGLAGGALVGGWLSGLGNQYVGNNLLSLLLYVMLFFLILIFAKEHWEPGNVLQKNEAFRIGMQIKDSIGFVAQKGLMRVLLLIVFFTGVALFSIETYWQPALKALSSQTWLLGVVSFAGFFCVILGSKAAELLLIKKTDRGTVLLLACKAMFGISLIILRFQIQSSLFIGTYMLTYFFVGGGSVIENTLLNRMVSPGLRASVLSLFSFVLQTGGLVTSLLGYLVSAQMDFRNMWLISGILLSLGAVFFALIRFRECPEAATENAVQLPDTGSAEKPPKAPSYLTETNP